MKLLDVSLLVCFLRVGMELTTPGAMRPQPAAGRINGGAFLTRQARGDKKSMFIWSRVDDPNPHCGLVAKRPSLSLTPTPVEIE